jgi:ABC-type nitrate/sulfonate/bicarbonate transport system permease component
LRTYREDKLTGADNRKENRKPDIRDFLNKVFAIRDDVHPLTAAVLFLMPLFIVIVIWTIITWLPPEQRKISSYILPSPMEFLQYIPKILLPEKKLGIGIATSLLRIMGGFLIATACALPLGILMGSFSRFRAALHSLIVIGSYIPIPTLLPLTIVWLDTGETQKVGFLAIACFVYLLPAIVKALDNVDDVFLNTGYTLGADKWQVVWKILIPIALPDIYNSLRMGFGVGFTWIIVAEMINAESGLGYIMRNAQTRGADNTIVYMVLLIIVLLAFIIDRIWETGYRLIFRYKEAR